MSLYAVKNDQGEYAFYGIGDPHWEVVFGTLWSEFNKPYAERTAKDIGGHVVELVEAQAKIVVSEEEAKMLKKAKDTAVWRPAAVISKYAYNYEKNYDQEALLEDRLMHAYANGYTVAKEKKYNVKVPLVQAQGGLWFYINSEDKLGATCLKKMAKKFTMDEIEENGLQDCEKEDVTDDAD